MIKINRRNLLVGMGLAGVSAALARGHEVALFNRGEVFCLRQ